LLLQSQRKALKEQLKALNEQLKALEAQLRQQPKDEGDRFVRFQQLLRSRFADLVHFFNRYIYPALPSTAQVSFFVAFVLCFVMYRLKTLRNRRRMQ
jgi:Flp pilus assembly protein TadB